ncbi:MAG TPA: ice-binding family protein [Solirubrobacterales bacterium]|nr:ice-binding family protein [Solirubrobacterales bacterium]
MSTSVVSMLRIVSLVTMASLLLAGSSQAATSVGLGTADSFAVLAGAGVTNTGPSVINGDLGSSPTPAVTGFGGAPNGTVNGATHQADALAAQAQADLTTAYNDAAGQGPPNTLATELGGQTLTPGVYDSESGTFGITGTLTLNGQGDPDAVFIFKTASTLISASSSQVLTINGAQPCHLFWQVGSSATLGTDSAFAGNILALESIQLNSGVTVLGRLLARNASVTLINDTVTRADCAVPETVGAGGDNDGGGGGGGGEAGGGGETGGGSTTGGGGAGRGGNRGAASRPSAQITGVPRSGGRAGASPDRRAPCTDRGFKARIRIHSRRRMRRVSVYLDGRPIERTTRKRFTVWIRVLGLRAGRNTIRVVAVDRRGRHGVASRSFRRCARAAPSPDFTG